MSSAGRHPGDLRVVSARRSIPTHLREIWGFRELLGSLIRKELKVRYKNSVLGFAWSMAQPVFLLVVYTFVFSVLGQGFERFSIWLLCGLIVWTLISTTLVTATQSITANANLVGKVPFPRAVLPLAAFGSAFVHFMLQFATFAVILLVTRHDIDFGYVWLLPLALLSLSVLLAAMALAFAVVNVHARDTQHLLDLALVAMFWANPIVYEYQRAATWFSSHNLPSWLPLLNPFATVITTFQRAIYGRAAVGGRQLLPDTGPWWYLRNIGIVGGVSVGLLAWALWFFDRSEGNLAEVL